jgi:hypothetical protein
MPKIKNNQENEATSPLIRVPEKVGLSTSMGHSADPRTRGREVMRLASSLAEDPWRSGDHYDDHLLYFDVESLKNKFRNISEPARQTIDVYFDISAPEFIVDVKNKSDQSSWADWLSKEATLPELVNVAEWHNHVLGEQSSDPEIKSAIELEKSRFTQAANDLYAQGVIAKPPKDARDLEVAIVDVFDDVLLTSGGNAYFSPYVKNQLNVVQGQGRTEETRRQDSIHQIRYSLPHELTHWGIGTSDGILGGLQAPRWIDEAFTEEVTRMLGAQLGSAGNRPIVYLAERKLLELVLSGVPSEHTVPDSPNRLATRAYSGDQDAKDELLLTIDEIWGVNDTLKKVSQMVINTERENANNIRGARRALMDTIAILSNSDRSLVREQLNSVS